MKKEMLINVLQPEECRIAIVENGVLEELYVERNSHESYTGNIYKGKIVNLEPAIQAAFVNFSVGRNGFLHVSDVEPRYFDRHPPGDEESESRAGGETVTGARSASRAATALAVGMIGAPGCPPSQARFRPRFPLRRLESRTGPAIGIGTAIETGGANASVPISRSGAVVTDRNRHGGSARGWRTKVPTRSRGLTRRSRRRQQVRRTRKTSAPGYPNPRSPARGPRRPNAAGARRSAGRTSPSLTGCRNSGPSGNRGTTSHRNRRDVNSSPRYRSIPTCHPAGPIAPAPRPNASGRPIGKARSEPRTGFRRPSRQTASSGIGQSQGLRSPRSSHSVAGSQDGDAVAAERRPDQAVCVRRRRPNVGNPPCRSPAGRRPVTFRVASLSSEETPRFEEPPRRRGGRAAIRSRGGDWDRPRETPIAPEPGIDRLSDTERRRSTEAVEPGHEREPERDRPRDRDRERPRPHARAGEPGYIPRRERLHSGESSFGSELFPAESEWLEPEADHLLEEETGARTPDLADEEDPNLLEDEAAAGPGPAAGRTSPSPPSRPASRAGPRAGPVRGPTPARAR